MSIATSTHVAIDPPSIKGKQANLPFPFASGHEPPLLSWPAACVTVDSKLFFLRFLSFVFLFLSLGNPKNRKWSYIAVKGGLEVARSSSSNGGGDAIQLLRTDVCKRVMRRVYI